MLLGLFFRADVTGRDPSKWKVTGWLYNEIFYNTTEDFRKAYHSPGFEKLAPNVEGQWVRLDRNGPKLPMDAAPPPQGLAPAGPRYSVDQQAKYVEWMDFSFYIGFTRDRGMAFYDIRHKGQRILYELSLQEALAHYAGNEPVQSGTAYFGSFYGFGYVKNLSLRRGHRLLSLRCFRRLEVTTNKLDTHLLTLLPIFFQQAL